MARRPQLRVVPSFPAGDRSIDTTRVRAHRRGAPPTMPPLPELSSPSAAAPLRVVAARGRGDDTLLGRVIDRYQVVGLLGKGGMGSVYRVRHVRLDRHFAMKVLRRRAARNSDFVARFEQEALSTSRLHHLNCISVTDFGQAASGELYLVMELLLGQPLTALLGTPQPVSRALEITRQILLGLAHAHDAGVLHRDVKPDNVMLLEAPGGGPLVKVLDFGLARLASDAPLGSLRRITRADMVCGTPSYMAPELVDGADPDARCDVYAVGSVLFYLLTGRRPFEADSALLLLRHKYEREAPPLDEVAPGVFAPALARLVAASLARDPRRRLSSAARFLELLDEVRTAPGGGLAVHRRGASSWLRRRPRPPARAGARRARWGAPPLFHGLVLAFFALAALALAVSFCTPTASPPPAAPPPPAAAAVTVPRRAAAPRPPAPAGAKASRPDSPAARATFARLDRCLQLVHRRRCDEAVLRLKRLLDSVPQLAAAHYVLGSAQSCRGEHIAAIAAFRRAIKYDRSYRRDPHLLRTVGDLLATPGAGRAALRLLARDVGRPALRRVLEATTSLDHTLRHRAVRAALRLGGRGRIDWVTVCHLDLQQARSCRQRRRVVARLRRLRDPRAAALLRDPQVARAARCRLERARRRGRTRRRGRRRSRARTRRRSS